jgi:3-oxoadipate enol-lactonase
MRNVGKNINLLVNHQNISYTDLGPDNAPAIIFIHGFPLNKSMWDSQLELLTGNFRVIAYDLRGFGNSDAGEEDFSMRLFVQDLIGLMDALNIEKASICGLSLGGYIALNAIQNFPNRFEAMILCDTNCIADTPEVAGKRIKTIESIRENGVEQYAASSLKNLFAPESFAANKEAIASVKTMIMETSVQSLSKTLIALTQRKETYTKLTDIKVPVLIMVGKEDILTPPESAIQIQKRIKGSVLNILDHAGHLSNIENSKEFNFQLSRFVGSVYQPSDQYTKRNQEQSESNYMGILTNYQDIEKDLNSKIMAVTMKIKDHHPELSKYLEEMPVTVPTEKDPEISMHHLQTYYESLNSLLNKYKADYPKIEE